jgi:hypothetical protein
MKEWLKTLEAYISFSILGFTIFICVIVIIVNCRYIIKLENTIETMWHEIVQVKETNIDLHQFIEEHKNDFD